MVQQYASIMRAHHCTNEGSASMVERIVAAGEYLSAWQIEALTTSLGRAIGAGVVHVEQARELLDKLEHASRVRLVYEPR
jgi:hypothetical protein